MIRSFRCSRSPNPPTSPFVNTERKLIRTSAAAFCSGTSATMARKTVSRIARCGNTRDDSPHNRYHIDPRELIRIQREGRERGEDIVGFYHSHPDHPARWSPTDLAEAHWFGCSYVITSVEKGKAAITNSFELTGSERTMTNKKFDKKFVDEKWSDGGGLNIFDLHLSPVP
jgi:proteasome lid subunit RPN8/RPN11